MAVQAKRELLLQTPDYEFVIEELCMQGCQAVRRAVAALEQGGDVALTQGLDHVDRACVLHELRAVMAVYDN